MSDNNRPVPRCSFCGKTAKQVKKMIAGPGETYICNDCVELCNESWRKRCPSVKNTPRMSI